MTEKKTETAASKGPVRQLHECARLAGFDPATGWPDELPFKGVINILAGSWKLSDAGRKEWARVISAAIKPGGGLATTSEATTFQPAPKKIGSLAGYGRFSHWATGLDPKMEVTPAPEIRITQYVTRTALAAWLRAIGETAETLSPCALLWLGREWQPAQAPESAAEPSKAIRDQIRAYLKDMATHDPSFDCMKMPGEKVDFHALLACMDSDCLAAKPGTFDGYLKKPAYLCKFETAGRNPGFYEGMAEKMGVNSGKYRRALGKKEAEYEKAKAKRQSGPA